MDSVLTLNIKVNLKVDLEVEADISFTILDIKEILGPLTEIAA
jgi:hypothetical protein